MGMNGDETYAERELEGMLAHLEFEVKMGTPIEIAGRAIRERMIELLATELEEPGPCEECEEKDRQIEELYSKDQVDERVKDATDDLRQEIKDLEGRCAELAKERDHYKSIVFGPRQAVEIAEAAE